MEKINVEKAIILFINKLYKHLMKEQISYQKIDSIFELKNGLILSQIITKNKYLSKLENSETIISQLIANKFDKNICQLIAFNLINNCIEKQELIKILVTIINCIFLVQLNDNLKTIVENEINLINGIPNNIHFNNELITERLIKGLFELKCVQKYLNHNNQLSDNKDLKKIDSTVDSIEDNLVLSHKNSIQSIDTSGNYYHKFFTNF
jgi:hypothetical protein